MASGIQNSQSDSQQLPNLTITLKPCNDKIDLVVANSLFDQELNLLPNVKCPVCCQDVRMYSIDKGTVALATAAALAVFALLGLAVNPPRED